MDHSDKDIKPTSSETNHSQEVCVGAPRRSPLGAHHAGAPWARTTHPWSDSSHSRTWHSKRRFLARRFALYFGLFTLLVFGGMAILSALATRLVGGTHQTAFMVWLFGCSLAFALPMMAVGVAMRGYRRFATPLVNVMTAADAVADGDLSVRVPEDAQGELNRLARSFNRMTEELERSDQRRRNLTADVAHELRTPLHVIQGNLEGVLDGVYEPTAEHIEATLEETQTLARLVDDLRTLSLAEGGQLPLVQEMVDIPDLLADIETSFGGQAESNGIDLVVKIEGDPSALIVPGDAGRLDQVFSNLVVNALRHTPTGGSILLQAQPNGNGVEIRVQDSGEGIPSEDLPYIFDRFWRGDRSRTHADGSGGGLGLAIARQLVQAHGGTIAVESEVGVGTEFVVGLVGEE